MTARLPLVLLAAATLTRQACAAPCDAASERTEMVASLRLAAEERPVHVTFTTKADGVKLPANLIERYPDEITIILQYQFDRLVLQNDGFGVGLWFKGKYARLTVPFAAVKEFYDNAVRTCGPDDKDAMPPRP